MVDVRIDPVFITHRLKEWTEDVLKGSDKCFISVLNAFFTAGLRTEGKRKREIWIKICRAE